MTTQQQTVHKIFLRLLEETAQANDSSAPYSYMDHKGKYTAQDVIDALARGDRMGNAYVRSLLMQTIEGIFGDDEDAHKAFYASSEFASLGEDPFGQAVTQGVRKLFIQTYRFFPPDKTAWRYMSRTYNAKEWADGIESGDSTVLGTMSDMLRISRDILKFRASPDDMEADFDTTLNLL